MIYFRERWVLKGMNWLKVDVKERWQMEWTTRRSDSITERITSSAFTLLQDATIPMWNQYCQTFVKIPNQTSSSWTPVCGTSAGESLRSVIFNIRVKVYGLYGFVGHSRHSVTCCCELASVILHCSSCFNNIFFSRTTGLIITKFDIHVV